MLHELEGRPLDHWLRPLLASCERRGWIPQVHVDGDKATADEAWPRERRWGPPRDAARALEQLERAERPLRNLLLRCSGPYAGAALALEQGLHRYGGLPGGEPAVLVVRLLALRTRLSDLEWLDARVLPRSTVELDALGRLPAARHYERPAGPCRLLGGEREVKLPLAHYWARFEELGAQHLLAYEEDDAREIDQLYQPVLPGGGGGGR
jgi:hypothetical protein